MKDNSVFRLIEVNRKKIGKLLQQRTMLKYLTILTPICACAYYLKILQK